MSEAPLEAPYSIKYSEILFMNDAWIEATHPNKRFTCYAILPRSSEIAKIVFKDLDGKEIAFCFDKPATILFEGKDTIWYNETLRIQC